VDDEDPALVRKFLTKVPIDGWIGLDTSGKLIAAYDAQVRPRTFVIDTRGRIAATLRPEQLNKVQLLLLAEEKPVVFPEDKNLALNESLNEAKAAADREAVDTGGTSPLFDISIRAGDPNGQTALIDNRGRNGAPWALDIRNAPLMMLLADALHIPFDRIPMQESAMFARYTLHVNAPNGDMEQLAPALELALAGATGIKLRHVSQEQDAYVLQATPKAASLLSAADSKRGSLCFYEAQSGKLMLTSCSLNKLAQTLEGAMGTPVVNETGIAGEFDAIFDLPIHDNQAAAAAIEKNLGLTLTKARRSIDRIVVDPPEASDKPKPPRTP
jgi:uncharacterized protein (TIGR03435 family)